MFIMRLAPAAENCHQRMRETGNRRHVKVDHGWQSTVYIVAAFPVTGTEVHAAMLLAGLGY